MRLRLLMARLVLGVSISSPLRINHHKYCISMAYCESYGEVLRVKKGGLIWQLCLLISDL